jgi:MarR-like DNA-binding transcriptional regulator SgrR of sgrS sRNA
MHNTYTYRHSDLPSVRPEVQAEIVALDVQLADLILKSQGNYRELEQIAEVLDRCMDTCQLNLQSIRIIADDTQQPIATLKDLALEDKELIYSISFTNSVLLNLLSSLTHRQPEEIGKELALLASLHKQTPTVAEIDELITQLTLARSNAKDGFVFKRMKQPT